MKGGKHVSDSIELIRKAEQNTTIWSGGTTTQIAIYPSNAEYSKRNFIWRLSSAKVDLAQSTFTSLPGISRVLMVIDGVLKLEHEGHHSAYLKPFEQDHFCGDWITKSVGKVNDFNLMMSQECQGKLTAIQLGERESIEISVRTGKGCNHCTSVFYCIDGSVRFLAEEERTYELYAKDALILHRKHENKKNTLRISNLESKQVHLIRADMQY